MGVVRRVLDTESVSNGRRLTLLFDASGGFLKCAGHEFPHYFARKCGHLDCCSVRFVMFIVKRVANALYRSAAENFKFKLFAFWITDRISAEPLSPPITLHVCRCAGVQVCRCQGREEKKKVEVGC